MDQLKDIMRAFTRTLLAFGLIAITGYLLAKSIEVPDALWALDGTALAFYYRTTMNGGGG